jgi:hypothetical protein
MAALKPRSLDASFSDTTLARDLFWQNMMREMLTALSVESINRQARAAHAAADGKPPPQEEGVNLFDGRLGILTHAGERIPIAEVYPLLACGISTSDEAKVLSIAVECTVFQVRTPAGEVYTLPLKEMRGLHALTPELMQALQDAARRESGDTGEDGTEPFGFAAFTSLARAKPAIAPPPEVPLP